METDVDLALELAGKTRPQPRACWPNSIYALSAFRMANRCLAERSYYVEGWLIICDGSIPIEHGWLEIADKVVDVTLPGQYSGEMYHPVHVYTYDRVMRRIGRSSLPLYAKKTEDWRKMNDAWLQLPCNEGVREFFLKLTTESQERART